MPLKLTGNDLTVESLGLLARSEETIEIPAKAMDGVQRAEQVLINAATAGNVYGATTGVGANRTVVLDSVASSQTLRLWRSSCAGVGPLVDDEIARAAMIVRLNQVLAGGSGLSVELTSALESAIEAGRVPQLHEGGSIGTGDLSALAELALTLIGERPWKDGTFTPAAHGGYDGLPFISSSALTLATAASALERLERIVNALTIVTGLSFLAMRGSVEPYLPPQLSESAAVSETLLALVRPAGDQAATAARVQDPFGLRAFPQVHSAAVEALRRVRDILKETINGVHENPSMGGGLVRHNGRFDLSRLGLAIDNARSALVTTLTLSSGRLSRLLDPAITGLTPFISDGAPGSSGLMICEYVAEDALAELRLLSAPTAGAAISISLGTEEHASFASQSARALRRMVEGATTVAAMEMLAAYRALVASPDRVVSEPLRVVFEDLALVLSHDLRDSPLDSDAQAARTVLPTLPDIVDRTKIASARWIA